jgi:hypothetical protein
MKTYPDLRVLLRVSSSTSIVDGNAFRLRPRLLSVGGVRRWIGTVGGADGCCGGAELRGSRRGGMVVVEMVVVKSQE